jgi:hypothetical protein
VIIAALNTARTWVGRTVTVLGEYVGGSATPTARRAVETALRDNFHTTDPLFVSRIHANFVTLQTALGQSLRFECVPGCMAGDLAFVFTDPTRLGLPERLINLCPRFFDCVPMQRAATMIHERAHEALGAQDHVYEWSHQYDTLPTMLAITNADCYAVAARQIFHYGFFGPGISCDGRMPRLRRLVLPEPRFPAPPPPPTVAPPE